MHNMWWECTECGYKPASEGDMKMHLQITGHADMVFVEDEN